MSAVHVDAVLENADWLRSMTWDLPTTSDGFLGTLDVTGRTEAEALVAFMKLPAAKAMPHGLIADLAAHGYVV